MTQEVFQGRCVFAEAGAETQGLGRRHAQLGAHAAVPHRQVALRPSSVSHAVRSARVFTPSLVISASYLIAHSFGRRMLYPGSVGLLQKAMRPMLQQGQARLIEEFNGQRNKLLACDGNEIDTMFVDRRGDASERGKTLVICCEGNAGFYEVGCMNTPLEGGYSVLGWNHPGFGGSTGVPFPQNEANAMDVVVQFAVHKLGFQLSDIVVYAWSIGGFTASWAAMTYPEIRALVLDASFDDLLPLALKVMPDSWSEFGGEVELLLLLALFFLTFTLTHSADAFLQSNLQLYSSYEVDDDWCVSVLQSYQTDRETLFPWSVGEDMALEGRRQLALFLARKYMRNFETTHCTPLPHSEFYPPWRL
uniref:Abhydrolase domain containing 16A, phospholipase n=1 Tax=Scleropages formosus TaxID=113540 RepID=A0A8C9TD10_SCLFO